MIQSRVEPFACERNSFAIVCSIVQRYPFHPSQNYILKGTGRGRCCAFLWGTIIGLAALGLLLGMLLGYLPSKLLHVLRRSAAALQ
jgi:hypothetical protein